MELTYRERIEHLPRYNRPYRRCNIRLRLVHDGIVDDTTDIFVDSALPIFL